MRRFLFWAVAGLVLALGSFYLIFYQGFYLPVNQNEPLEALFCTKGKEVMRWQEDGTYTPLAVKSVDVAASIPGSHDTEFSAKEEDYLRWLEAIAAMGANTIRVASLMDDDFYHAFYQYNTMSEAPLYLIQGILVDDRANYGKEDAYHEEFLGALLKDARDAVDIVHGRKMLSTAEISGGGQYFKDISAWVLGYLVGSEWTADTVAYTDHSVSVDGAYEGVYFTTSQEATPFEAMLAQVMDELAAYETGKYNRQRLIGFASAPDIDFLAYEEQYARQIGKYAYVDSEHILPTEALHSGYYVSYRMFDFCDDFREYLADGQGDTVVKALAQIDTGRSYAGYLDLLGAYHTMPVMVSYGVSSGRGAVTIGEPPLTEQEQGEALIRIWQDAVHAGLFGVSLSTWQDSWDRKSWNTAFAADSDNAYLWHDAQTQSQHYGLMAFASGEEAVCLVDGSLEEWEEEACVMEANGISLYAEKDGGGYISC